MYIESVNINADIIYPYIVPMLYRKSTSDPKCSVRFISRMPFRHPGRQLLKRCHFIHRTSFRRAYNLPNVHSYRPNLRYSPLRWAHSLLVQTPAHRGNCLHGVMVLLAASCNQFASSFIRATIIEYR